MKTQKEIQYAHDIFHSQVTGETPFVFDEETRPIVHAILDTLCWVLQHDHSDSFQKNLTLVKEELAKRGYELKESPVPIQARQYGEG